MYKIIIAGFGGQGILFSGKQLALAAMNAGLNVTTLPSYGAEMRGGTSSCTIIIDEDFIGSPYAESPSVLIAMNAPSYDKFEPKVSKNGFVFVNSTLSKTVSARTDIKAFYIPVTALADANGLNGLANVIMLGKLIKETKIFEYGYFENSLTAASAKSKPELAKLNAAALKIGFEYEG